MRGTVKFLGAIATAFLVMLVFRGLVMTVCTIEVTDWLRSLRPVTAWW